jgi:hypothetical protein
VDPHEEPEVHEEQILAYKGFDENLRCRGFQYEVGKTFTHEGMVKTCEAGFHACEYPLDVFCFYPPAGNRFAVVKQSGVHRDDDDDPKLASRSISIITEIDLSEVAKAAIEYTTCRCNPESRTSDTDDYGAALATGYRNAALVTGDHGAASATGYQCLATATDNYGAALATGYHGAATATGDQGAASVAGDHGAATVTGDYGAASATSYRSAATVTGDHGAALVTGDYGAASATGESSVAVATGVDGRAKGAEGCAIVIGYRDNSGKLTHIRASLVGENGIKPGVWYVLDKDGEFREAEEVAE